MSKNLPPKLLLIAIVPLAACKTWYKAGANEEDLSMDQQRCEAQRGTSTDERFLECMEHAKRACDETAAAGEVFSECMKGRGWRRLRLTVEEPDDLD